MWCKVVGGRYLGLLCLCVVSKNVGFVVCWVDERVFFFVLMCGICFWCGERCFYFVVELECLGGWIVGGDGDF